MGKIVLDNESFIRLFKGEEIVVHILVGEETELKKIQEYFEKLDIEIEKVIDELNSLVLNINLEILMNLFKDFPSVSVYLDTQISIMRDEDD